VAGKSGAKIGALPSAEPELIGTDGAVALADHLELQIGDDGSKRQRRMREEVLIALAAGFLTSEADEEDGAPRPWRHRAERTGELQHGRCAAGIVVGSVVNDFTVGRCARAKVIEVGAEQDRLPCELGIGAAKQGNGVVGCAARGERDALHLCPFQSERLELRDHIGGGHQFVPGGAAASAQSVRG